MRFPTVAAALIIGLGVGTFIPYNQGQAAQELDKTEIHQIIRDYLVDNPEVIKDALISLREKEQSDQQQAFRDVLQSNVTQLFESDSPASAIEAPKVHVVEFFDYQCHHCKKMSPAVAKVLEQNNDVRVVYKELPVLGKESVMASQAALASIPQGKYEVFHHKLMENADPLTPDRIFEIGREVGLDIEQLQKDMQSPLIEKKLNDNLQLARTIGLRGTPAFVVAPHPISETSAPVLLAGAIGYERLQSTINEQRDSKGNESE